MKGTLWGPTLIVNHIRAAFAGVVWAILFFFSDQPDAPVLQSLLLPAGYLLVFLPMSLLSIGLSKLGVPFIGWFPVVLSLMLLPGDPPTYLLHKFAPQLVPVERYSLLNFTTIILVKHPTALLQRQ